METPNYRRNSLAAQLTFANVLDSQNKQNDLSPREQLKEQIQKLIGVQQEEDENQKVNPEQKAQMDYIFNKNFEIINKYGKLRNSNTTHTTQVKRIHVHAAQQHDYNSGGSSTP